MINALVALRSEAHQGHGNCMELPYQDETFLNSEAELGPESRHGFSIEIGLARVDHLQVSRQDEPGGDGKFIVDLKPLLVVER